MCTCGACHGPMLSHVQRGMQPYGWTTQRGAAHLGARACCCPGVALARVAGPSHRPVPPLAPTPAAPCPRLHAPLCPQYPKEDKERRKLVYFCRSCGYQEDAHPSEWCVYRNEVQHTSREKSVVLQVGKGVWDGGVRWGRDDVCVCVCVRVL